MREEDSLHPDAARVPPAGLRGGSEGADGLLSGRTVRRRLRCGNRAGLERRARQPRIPVPRGAGSGPWRPAPPTASAISSWHPACRFFSGAASPTTSCSMRPFEARSAGRTCSSDRSGECSPILARTISRATSPGSGCGLRNLESVDPNVRLYPDFDDNLRQAFRQETELFVDSILREDRSVLDLIKADYTFLNERLAKHYGIPHVYGSRFRRVALGPDSKRGGLLRHGSILAVTSVCDADVAGASWRVGPRQHLRRAAAASAPECAGARRKFGGRQPPDAAAAGRPSHQPGVRELSPDDRPGGVLRWRTSTPWVAGGIRTGTADPLTCRGPCPAPASSAAWLASKKGCCAVRSCSRER